MDVRSLLKIFVNVVNDVPLHRRVLLFTILVRSISEAELHIALGLLFSKNFDNIGELV